MTTAKNLATALLLTAILWTGSGSAQEVNEANHIEPVQTRSHGAFPRIGKYEVLRGDFHIHTTHSDGRQAPQQRVFEAWRHGYDVIAITDHGNHAAHAEALPVAEALGVVLLRGLETGIQKNEHIVAFGLTDTYSPRDPHMWAEDADAEQVYYREQFAKLSQAGAVALYAHPHVGLRPPIEWAIAEGHLIGVEVKNALVGSEWGSAESHGTWCYPFAFDWALEHNLTLFANTDVHYDRQDSWQAMTLVLATERTPKAVMKAIRDRRTVAWFDGMLWGRQDLLEFMFKHLVSVARVPSAGDDTSWIRIVNRGPVHLTARLVGAGLGEEPVSIEPYGEVLLAGPFDKTVSIDWGNVHTSSSTTLVTQHVFR